MKGTLVVGGFEPSTFRSLTARLQSVSFLRYIIESGQVSMDPEKILEI